MDHSKQAFIDPNAPTFGGFEYNDMYAFGGYLCSSPRLGDFSNMSLGGMPDYGAAYPHSSPAYTPVPSTPLQRPYTPVDSLSVSPQTTLNLALSAAALSAASASDNDHGASGSGMHGSSGRSVSPPDLVTRSSVASQSSLVHRQPLRHSQSSSSTATRASARERPPKRRPSKSEDSDDEGDDIDYAPSAGDGSSHRLQGGAKETVRRQRIESEQRRRDELRDGYRKLKDVLPASNQKSSKVSLLDRATLHIKYLEMTQSQLQARLQSAEMETQRLRLVNEKLMLGAAEHNQQMHGVHSAPLSSF